MKYYELLQVNMSFIKLLKKNGVVLSDVEMLQIYSKYLQMVKTNYKKAYIMAKLSEEAGIATRTLYVIINRMESEVSI